MLVSHRNTLEMENVVFAIAAVVWVGESDYNSCRAIIDGIKWKKYLFLKKIWFVPVWTIKLLPTTTFKCRVGGEVAHIAGGECDIIFQFLSSLGIWFLDTHISFHASGWKMHFYALFMITKVISAGKLPAGKS